MSGATTIRDGASVAPEQTATVLGRAGALLEVLLAFHLVHFTYRSFKHFTELGRSEVAAGLNFSPGTTMILFTVVVLLVCRRNFPAYGLTFQGWRYNLNIGLLWATIVVAAGGLVLALSPVHVDPLHPPDLARASAFSCGWLILTLLVALFLRRERRLVGLVPSSVALLALTGLLLLPVVLAVFSQRSVGNEILSVLWNFCGAGIGEEVFFRGYIQPRVDKAFGRPCTLLGVRFGLGLSVSSALFGWIHALNTVDYFSGRYDFAWLWLIVNCCSGLFFGVLREKRGSVVPGAIVHGLEDVLGRVPTLLP
jgi:membrane protease YdiL (CAAX protease family)